MIRYYIAPVIGTGATLEDAFRSKISDYGVPTAVIIPTGSDGKPTSTWCLNVVNTKNHAPLLSDPEIFALPDVPLDIKLNAMAQAQQTRITNKMTELGIDTIHDGQTAYREMLRKIGQKLAPTFNENNFWVS